jgi:hypothetical protein
MGVQASCPHRHSPYPPRKRWFALLWGKAKQTGVRVRMELRALVTVVPVLATCAEACDALDSASVFNLGLSPRRMHNELIAQAFVMVGIKAPRFGASVAEALACGTYVVAKAEHVPREFHQHPLVRIVDDNQYAATVQALMLKHSYKADRLPNTQAGPTHRNPPAPRGGPAIRLAGSYVRLPRNWCPVDVPSTAPPPTTVSDDNATATRKPLPPSCHDHRLYTRSWLPARYSGQGYTEWVRRSLGVADGTCRLVDRAAPIQQMIARPWGSPSPCGDV